MCCEGVQLRHRQVKLTIFTYVRASPLAPPKAPQTPFGGAGAKNPAQLRPQTDFSSGAGCFFVWRTRSKPSARGRGGGRGVGERGRRLRPKTSWAIPIGETLPFFLKIHHRISHSHQVAAASPRRTIPRWCTFLPPNRGSCTPYRPRPPTF
jgi:hypothetical protein